MVDPSVNDLVTAFAIVSGIIAVIGIAVAVAVVLVIGRARAETEKLLREQNTALREERKDHQGEIHELQAQNAEQGAAIGQLQELVTQKAAVDALATSMEKAHSEIARGIAEMHRDIAKYQADEAHAREEGRRSTNEEHTALLSALEFITTRVLATPGSGAKDVTG